MTTHDVLSIYQDLPETYDCPLTDYYINSSHNTYLLGNQLWGTSTTHGYRNAMGKQGSRCLEIDIWENSLDEPIIYHGYTFTSKISLSSVLRTLREYAFKDNPYPVLLSLEIHAKERCQKRITETFLQELGEMIYTFQDDSLHYLPSPNNLKYKFLLKGSITSPIILFNQSKFNLSHTRKIWEISSLSEYKFNHLPKLYYSLTPTYHQRHLTRIYPAGFRIDSSNFNPLPAWETGAQLVALNLQTEDDFLLLNYAKFGQSGYKLKPSSLLSYPSRSSSRQNNTVIKVVKFVFSTFFSLPSSSAKIEIKMFQPNKVITLSCSINQMTDSEPVIFEIEKPEFTTFIFHISSTSLKKRFGSYAIELQNMKPGYRIIPLINENYFISCYLSMTQGA